MAVLESLHAVMGGYMGLLVLLLPITYVLQQIIYNLYFHPLARFPGPFLHCVSRLTYFYKHVNGTLPFDLLDMHRKYGNIVRVAPDELSLSHPDAWNDVMGHKTGTEELMKAEWFYRPIEEMPRNIVSENRVQHGMLRRTLAHGFSDKGMREQEPIISGYVDLLIRKLRERSGKGKAPVIISDWYNFCTFDVIGDLAFGESFGCLESSDYHVWIKGIFAGGRIGTILQALSFVPRLKRGLMNLVPKKLRDEQEMHKQLTKAKMMRRIESGGDRPDLIGGLLKKKDDLGLSLDQIVGNAEILIIGGSETTATLLSGVTYFLTMNPDILAKLTAEVRETFSSEDEIDLSSVHRLTYMLACLNEGLRMYPPIANGLPRIVPSSGATIMGEFIPGNTTIAIHHWSLYRRPEFWTKANEFHPERFLGAPEFASDRRDALQPFQVGPRNCLGKNLAYSEMRMILARVVFNFDMKIADEARDWVQQKNYLMWQKGALKVYLTPRE